MASQPETPFWNVNVPEARHTKDCPPYLTYAFDSDKDRAILATPDADYRIQTWADLTHIINDNRLDLFQRVPSDLRLYREHNAKLTAEHGSIMEFVTKERLKWETMDPAPGLPFQVPENYKILLNDWPYGLEPGIVHLVVWTKFPLPSDPSSEIGDLDVVTRALVRRFVEQTFGEVVGAERVLWFKNWAALKSVHAVEHIHVLLRDPDPERVKEWTGEDVSLQDTVKREKKEAEEGKGKGE